jgi:hypothetical protein
MAGLHFPLPLPATINSAHLEAAMSPKPKPGILDIEAYVGGRAVIPGVAKVYKLSSNESPLRPSGKSTAWIRPASSHQAKARTRC